MVYARAHAPQSRRPLTRVCATLRRALLLRALQLGESEEFIDGDFAGKLGEILIRCNNVMYIRAAPEEGAGAAEMDD